MLKKKNFILLSLGVVLVFFSLSYILMTVYASNSIEYSLDTLEVECLFASEQELLTDMSILSKTEDFQGGISNSGTDKALVNSENIIVNGVNNIKLVELEEEYYVNNRLASRDASDSVGSYTESTYEKYYRIFGPSGSSKMGRYYYYPGGNSQALQDMVSFPIVVWSLDSSYNWYQRTVTLQTHKNIASTFKCIFGELLELPPEERTPIKTIGAYSYRQGSSTHTCGVAIDINWEENAEMTNSGIVTAGSYWRPGSDIYSMGPNSKTVQIFKKYGFGWGGEWTSKKDYMHFSYFNR